METLTAINEFVESNDIRANFLVNSGIILAFVWGCGAWMARRANAFDASFVRRNSIKSLQFLGVGAMSILIGWRCGLGAPERKAALNNVEAAVERPVAVIADKSEQSNDNKQGESEKPVRREPIFRLNAKPVVCGDHVGAPENSFELIGNENYRCKKCGQTGMLALSLVDGGLVFSPD